MEMLRRIVGRLKPPVARFLVRVLSSRFFLGVLRNAHDKPQRTRMFLDELALIIGPEERGLLPSLEEAPGQETDRFSYQSRYVDFGIKEGEKVLDIGSGGFPFPLATHLADLYEKDTPHRHEPLVRDGRPFDACDIEALPYEDKEFDFAYCSHVLEHVPCPAKACEEIMRVGKRGYIETPTRMSDIMCNFTRLEGHHRWHISLAGKSLVFVEWSERERRDTGHGEFFDMLRSRYANPFQSLVHEHRDLFVNMQLWTGTFSYYVFDRSGDMIARSSN